VKNQRLFYYDNRPIVITQDDLDIKDADEYCLDDYSFTGNTSRDWADEITIQDYTEEKYTRKIRRDTPEIVKDKQSELTKTWINAYRKQTRVMLIGLTAL